MGGLSVEEQNRFSSFHYYINLEQPQSSFWVFCYYCALSHNVCVFPCHLLLLKGGNGIFNMCNGLSACCAHEGETGSDECPEASVDWFGGTEKRSFTLPRPAVEPCTATGSNALANLLATNSRELSKLGGLSVVGQNRFFPSLFFFSLIWSSHNRHSDYSATTKCWLIRKNWKTVFHPASSGSRALRGSTTGSNALASFLATNSRELPENGVKCSEFV